MENDVSSVMDGRNGVLSARLAGGEYICPFPLGRLVIELVILGPELSRGL